MAIRSAVTTVNWMLIVTWQERGTSCSLKLGRWPGLLPCLLNAAGTHPKRGRTGSGTNTTGYSPTLGNSRVQLTNPASANPQVGSRGNRLVGLPTEESHGFSRGRRSRSTTTTKPTWWSSIERSPTSTTPSTTLGSSSDGCWNPDTTGRTASIRPTATYPNCCGPSPEAFASGRSWNRRAYPVSPDPEDVRPHRSNQRTRTGVESTRFTNMSIYGETMANPCPWNGIIPMRTG